MVGFREMFWKMNEWGVNDILLPFLLIFAITYAVLDKAQIFGNDKKNINVIISLVMGVLFVAPHATGAYPTGMDPVEIMNAAIPNVGIVMIGAILVLILIGVWGGNNLNFFRSSFATLLIILSSLGITIYIFGQAAGWWAMGGFPKIFGFLNDPESRALFLIFAIFLGVIFFVTSGGKNSSGEGEGGGKFLNWMMKDLDKISKFD
jgi:hypothetical protein